MYIFSYPFIAFLFFFLFVSATYSALNLYEGVENKRHTSVGKSQRERPTMCPTILFSLPLAQAKIGQNTIANRNSPQPIRSCNMPPNRHSFFFFFGREGCLCGNLESWANNWTYVFRVNTFILGSLKSFRTFFCDGPIKEAHCYLKERRGISTPSN